MYWGSLHPPWGQGIGSGLGSGVVHVIGAAIGGGQSDGALAGCAVGGDGGAVRLEANLGRAWAGCGTPNSS